MKGYKTLVAAALVAATGFLSGPEMTAWAAEHPATVSTGLAVLIAALRAVTTGPMFDKPKKE